MFYKIILLATNVNLPCIRKKSNHGPLENFMTAVRCAESPNKFKTEICFRQHYMDITKVISNWKQSHFMMTSWHGNASRIIGPLSGGWRDHQWFPLQRANDMELWWVFFVVSLNKLFNKQSGCHRLNLSITPWWNCSGHLWIPLTNMQCSFFSFSLLFDPTNRWTSSQVPRNLKFETKTDRPLHWSMMDSCPKKASNAEAWCFCFC